MRAAEFMRAIADVIDKLDGKESEPEVKGPLERDVFVPPLQTKIEIMKKMADVPQKNADLLAADDDDPLDG
jgi:hypothetical protein